MSALAIPQPTSLAQVEDTCASIEHWADSCDDVSAIRDTANKLAAIDEYLTRTSTDGRARVAATMRRLEVRIGDLLGPAEIGRPPQESSLASELTANERHKFRQMAANPEVVEQVIAGSTDAKPASRRQVMGAIRQHTSDLLPTTDWIDPEDLADDDIVNPEHGTAAEWQPAKPDLGNGVSHPARYSAELVDEFRKILGKWGLPSDNILDPFAGTGRIHQLQDDGWETIGIELEPEWANLHPDTRIGSALDLPFDPETFGAIVTSPTYGNRLADSHNASDPERRRSYTHDLGRDLHAENSGTLHWRNGTGGNEEYCTFHEKAWDEAVLVLKPGGLFVLNMCDHVRGSLVQPVTTWHTWCLGRLGLDWVETYTVPTRKLRQGENSNLREQEYIHVFRKPL